MPTEPAAAAREERAVDAIASRRLIPVGALVDELWWTEEPRELAKHLRVDEPTLDTRMANLYPLEVAQLEHHLEDEWLRIP